MPDGGFIEWLQRDAIERERPPRAHTFDKAAYLEKLARDFGPETARMAELWAEQEREARDKAVRREARKLDAAGRYGFR